MINELNVMAYIRGAIADAIAINKIFIEDYITHDEPYYYDESSEELTDEERKSLIVSNSQLFIDPKGTYDETTGKFTGFTLTKTSGDGKIISTPVIFIEIASRISGTVSIQGSRVYGESGFNIIVMVDKKRKFEIYKAEVINLLDFIEETFSQQTQKRIALGKAEFSDFMFAGLDCSGVL